MLGFMWMDMDTLLLLQYEGLLSTIMTFGRVYRSSPSVYSCPSITYNILDVTDCISTKPYKMMDLFFFWHFKKIAPRGLG